MAGLSWAGEEPTMFPFLIALAVPWRLLSPARLRARYGLLGSIISARSAIPGLEADSPFGMTIFPNVRWLRDPHHGCDGGDAIVGAACVMRR